MPRHTPSRFFFGFMLHSIQFQFSSLTVHTKTARFAFLQS